MPSTPKGSPRLNPSVVEMLNKYKNEEKPKLSTTITHYETTESSPGSSPVLRKVMNLPIFIISDSDDKNSDDEALIIETSEDDDCYIVGEASSPLEKTTSLAPSQNVSSSQPPSTTKRSNFTLDTDISYNFSTASPPSVKISVKKDGEKGPPKGEKKKKMPKADSGGKRRKPPSKMPGYKRKKMSLEDRDMEGENFNNDRVYDSDEEEAAYESAPKLRDKRKKVVQLLDNATEAELKMVSNMNPKKLEIITSSRPFGDWENAVRIFTNKTSLKASMLNMIADYILARDIVSDLMEKCVNLAIKTEQKIDGTGTLVTTQPASLNPGMRLSSYQLVGLNWLALMRNCHLNSILADEMGLGKTIQVIAFFAYLREHNLHDADIPHLVIVPSSTLDNWIAEFTKWCPSMMLAVYDGAFEDRKVLRKQWVKRGFGGVDVILTTYSCVVGTSDKPMFRLKEFNYIVYDEAHMLKNMRTTRFQAMISFNGNFKILLTGTPLQNNLLELMSLVTFLMPKLFEEKISYIRLLFNKTTKNAKTPHHDADMSSFERERISQAKRILKPFMLRRLKDDVLQDLPQKTVSVVKCPMVPDQARKYTELLREFKENINFTDDRSYMSYYMRLRKLCNHPLMLRYYFTEDKLQEMAVILSKDTKFKTRSREPEHIAEDFYFKGDYDLFVLYKNHPSLHELGYNIPNEAFCNTGKLRHLERLLKERKEGNHRVLIFSQFILMLDLLEEFLEIHNYTYLRLDGNTQVYDRQPIIDTYNNSDIFVFLLSTKAGGLGINLTAADTVIIHDIDFNPYNDKQAEDRCHRVGQTRPVVVYRLISAGTIEEKICEIAENKLYLEKEVTSSNEDAVESKNVLQLLQELLQE